MKTPIILLLMLVVGVVVPAFLAFLFGLIQRAAARRTMTKPPENVADLGKVTPALLASVIGAPLFLVAIVATLVAFGSPVFLSLAFYASIFGIVGAWLLHSLPGHKRNGKYALFYMSTQTFSGLMLVASNMKTSKSDFIVMFGVFVVGGALFNLVSAISCLRLFRPDEPLREGDPTSERALKWYRRVTWFQGSDFESGIVMAFLNVIGLSGVYLMIRWCVKARVGRHSIVYLRSFHYEGAGQVFGGVVTPALFRMAPSTGLVHLTQSAAALDKDVPLLWRSSFATINDANWQPWVERHLERALGVVLDVSVMSQSVEWEVATVRAKLPPERIVVLHRSDVAPPSVPGLTVVSYDTSSKTGIADARLKLAQWAAGALSSAVGKVATPVAVERPRFQLPVLAFLVLFIGLPISVLLGIALFVMAQFMDRSKVQLAQMNVQSLSTTVDLYRLSNGTCPPDLEALYPKYLDKPVGEDPWGKAYVYRCPGADGEGVELFSLGPDGDEGTEDDVKGRSRRSGY